jgi:hypothetical protein
MEREKVPEALWPIGKTHLGNLSIRSTHGLLKVEDN